VRSARRIPLYTVLVALTAVFVIPLVWMVLTSVKTYTDAQHSPPTWLPDPFSTYGYGRLFVAGSQNPVFRWFVNSMLAATLNAALILVTASMAAYALARMRFRGRRLMFANHFIRAGAKAGVEGIEVIVRDDDRGHDARVRIRLEMPQRLEHGVGWTERGVAQHRLEQRQIRREAARQLPRAPLGEEPRREPHEVREQPLHTAHQAPVDHHRHGPRAVRGGVCGILAYSYRRINARRHREPPVPRRRSRRGRRVRRTS